MNPRFPLWTVGLVMALLAVACVPAAPTESAPIEAVVQPAATAAPALTEAPANPTEAPAVIELPSYLPRGDALEASDPAAVALASGGLQLVEFFRFT